MVPLPKRSHSARRCSAKPAGRTMVPLTLSHCTVAVQGGSALHCWQRRDTETVELRLYPANVRLLRLRRNLNFQQFDWLTREGDGSFRTRLRFQNLTSSSFLRLVVEQATDSAGRELRRIYRVEDQEEPGGGLHLPHAARGPVHVPAVSGGRVFAGHQPMVLYAGVGDWGAAVTLALVRITELPVLFV